MSEESSCCKTHTESLVCRGRGVGIEEQARTLTDADAETAPGTAVNTAKVAAAKSWSWNFMIMLMRWIGIMRLCFIFSLWKIMATEVTPQATHKVAAPS